MRSRQHDAARSDPVSKRSPRSGGQSFHDDINCCKTLRCREKEVRELGDQMERDFLLNMEKHLREKEAPLEPEIVASLLKYVGWRKDIVEKGLIKSDIDIGLKEQYEESASVESRRDNRQAFLDARSSLLANHRGNFVAFIGGHVVGADTSFERLVSRLQGFEPLEDVYVELVDEAAFQEPVPTEMPGLHQVRPD